MTVDMATRSFPTLQCIESSKAKSLAEPEREGEYLLLNISNNVYVYMYSKKGCIKKDS